MIPLTWATLDKQIRETESRMDVTRAVGSREGWLFFFNGTEFMFELMKKL